MNILLYSNNIKILNYNFNIKFLKLYGIFNEIKLEKNIINFYFPLSHNLAINIPYDVNVLIKDKVLILYSYNKNSLSTFYNRLILLKKNSLYKYNTILPFNYNLKYKKFNIKKSSKKKK